MDGTQRREQGWVSRLLKGIAKFFIIALCLGALGAAGGLILGIFAPGSLLEPLLAGTGLGLIIGMFGGLGSVLCKDTSNAPQSAAHGGFSPGGGDGGAC